MTRNGKYLMSNEQLHQDVVELKGEMKEIVSVMRNLSDAVIILTENQKRIDTLLLKQDEQDKQFRTLDVRLSLTEAKVIAHEDKIKDLPQSTFISKATLWVGGLIVSGLVLGGFSLVYKLLENVITK